MTRRRPSPSTDKLGWEVRSDVTLPEMGDFRWLTVGPVGQEDFSVVLMAVPGQPVLEPETRQQVLDLAAKGLAGTVFLTTEDCRASYEEAQGPRRPVRRAARGAPPTASTRASATRPDARSAHR